MKIGKIKLYPLAVFTQLIVLYLIATDMHGWYIYALLGFIFLERAFLQFALWTLARIQKEVAKEMQAKLTEILSQAHAQGLIPKEENEDTESGS